MSKAIYGHFGGPDPLLVAEVTRLRRRVRELEEQVSSLEADLVSLPDSVDLVSLHGDEIDVALRELGTGTPALT
jgi:DNA invertase Pin-like site-specific DNA recombinase